MELSPTSHTDHFARESLPPREAWPWFEFTIPDVQYPTQLNAAEALIDEGVRKFGPDKTAIHIPGQESWSYGELQRRANQVAQVLTEDYDLKPGNRVLLRSPNNAWTVACWLGVIKAGGIVATTMVAWRKREVRNVVKRMCPNLAIIDHRAMSKMPSIFGETPIAIIGGDGDTLLSACASKSGVFSAVKTAADDVALLGATSGTTGEPKITMHFHRDILANADTFAKHTLNLTPDDVSAGTAPLAFTFGLGGLVVFPLRTGGSSVIVEKASPVELADLIGELGITTFYTAPTGYRAAIKEGKAAELARLRVAISAGEHLTKETFETVEEATGLQLVNGIGSTEMLHVFISAAGENIRPGATGKAVPGYRATVLDDDGNELPPGEVGRLAVIGPTGCRYLNDDRQKNYVVNGWNVTGDAYSMDEDGYFYYQSRTDSMIISAGYNIGAPEVEEVVEMHPEVLECAVIGRPDTEKGTIVNAFVVLRDGVAETEEITESIKSHVKEHLAVYKCPRRIDFIRKLPRNPSGKVQHFVLRERVAAEQTTTKTH